MGGVARDDRRGLAEAGQKIYKAILRSFVAREADMLACLDRNERRVLMGLLDKMIENSASWATPY